MEHLNKAGRGLGRPFRRGEGNLNWNGGREAAHHYYTRIYSPCHPRSTPHGYVYEHILIAERVLDNPLPPKAVIHHHIDKDMGFNPTSLVICQNHGYHLLLHQRLRALRACGHPEWRKCYICKTYGASDDPSFQSTSGGKTRTHRICMNRIRREQRVQGGTP